MASSVATDTLRRRALCEAERRAAPGTPAYLVAWFTVVLSDPTLREEVVPVVAITAVLAVVAFLRLRLSRGFEARVERDTARARRALHVLVLSNAAVLSLVAVLTVEWAPFAGSRELVLVMGAAVCGVGTMSLAMDAVLRRGMPLVILGPYAVTVLAGWSAADMGLLLMIVLFAAYLDRASALTHADWWRAAKVSQEQDARARVLERLSITDGLTGLANRMTFDQRLEAAWAQAQRSGSILSVLLIDLDHFKAINDTFGHATGDRCLIAAAEAIRACPQRRTDLVARHGGEEFAVLLPETAQLAAGALAEQVRSAIADVRVLFEGEPIPLSASIGVATLAPLRSDLHANELVDAADEALYAAKRAGRNRVEAAALP